MVASSRSIRKYSIVCARSGSVPVALTPLKGRGFPARFLRPAYYFPEHIMDEADSYLQTSGGKWSIPIVTLEQAHSM